SVLSEAACDQIKSLSPESSYAKELNEIEVVDVVIAREVEKVCNTATLGEITKISLLVNRLKRVNENEREKITDKLNNIAGKLIKRVENKTEPLKLSKICLELFSQL
ncbi:MAG: hypothetical protein ACYSRR_08500, partial [Planctomycetota bacterium]